MARQTIKTIEEVKEYAMSKYEEGGDIVIECWEDKDIEDFIAKCGRKSVRKTLDELFSAHNDRMKEAMHYMTDLSGYEEEEQTDVEVSANPTAEEEEDDMDKYLETFVRANRCTVQATEEGYVVHFYRTHKHIKDIEVKTTEGGHSNELREWARSFAIGQCPTYEIIWEPEMQKQAWERKYNTYNTDAEVSEDALTLITPAIDRLADKSRYDMVVNGIEVTDIRAKESSLTYVENGRYTKSGAWCVADIELEIDVTVGEHSMRMVYAMEMKSGQICKPKTTIAEWNEMVARELELNGIEIKEEKTA